MPKKQKPTIPITLACMSVSLTRYLPPWKAIDEMEPNAAPHAVERKKGFRTRETHCLRSKVDLSISALELSCCFSRPSDGGGGGGGGGVNEDDEVIELSKETQQQFMSYAGHFQMEGTRQLSDIVLQETRRIVDPIPLAQVCTPQDMYDLIESVRAGVERNFMPTPEEDPQINLCEILLPSEESQDPNEMHPHLLDLLDELRDILESEEFVQVFRETSTSCFTVLYSQLEKHIIASQRRQSETMTTQTTDVPTIHLANLVPRITKEAKTIFQDSSDNAYVDAVQDNQLLMRFCFMTYSLGVQL